MTSRPVISYYKGLLTGNKADRLSWINTENITEDLGGNWHGHLHNKKIVHYGQNMWFTLDNQGKEIE